MTAAATRETADHAELARLAEAAKSRLASGEWRADPNSPSFIWGDSLKGGDTHVAMVRGWGYLTGGGHGAIGLSEEDGLEAQLAALRGEVNGLKRAEAVAVHAADTMADRATQAERQRDEAYVAIKRLGSSEAFDMPRAIDGPLASEMRARMGYARAFLANHGAE